ncbi:hypothetical protein ABZ434_32185 [Streptomyces sp. NPDC005761]
MVAAWTSASDESTNTWYAVMRSPTVLLNQVMVELEKRADTSDAG